MSGTTTRPWWRRRRFLWPLATLALGTVLLWWAFLRAEKTRIVIYNESGAPLGELKVTACQQSRTFHALPENEAVRFSLEPRGGDSDIALAIDGLPVWAGDYVEPEHCTVLIHIREKNEIQCETHLSSWH